MSENVSRKNTLLQGLRVEGTESKGGPCTVEDYVRRITLKVPCCSRYQRELGFLSVHIPLDIYT